MDIQVSDTRIKTALAKLAQEEAEGFKEVSKWIFDNRIQELALLQHPAGIKLIAGAPAALNKAGLLGVDLEWYANDDTPKVPNSIKGNGYCIICRSDLKVCKHPGDLLALLKKLQVHHQRILETCHMRNRKPWAADAEKNSLYCETRFVPREKAIELFVDV
jgi:hypothetical protein